MNNYINNNKTDTFKSGDKVVMHNCYEASFKRNKGKVWTCETDSFKDKSNEDVVFLKGFSGSFCCEYLRLSELKDQKQKMFNHAVFIATLL